MPSLRACLLAKRPNEEEHFQNHPAESCYNRERGRFFWTGPDHMCSESEWLIVCCLSFSRLTITPTHSRRPGDASSSSRTDRGLIHYPDEIVVSVQSDVGDRRAKEYCPWVSIAFRPTRPSQQPLSQAEHCGCESCPGDLRNCFRLATNTHATVSVGRHLRDLGFSVQYRRSAAVAELCRRSSSGHDD